jgi:hypothetical protein
MPSHGFRIRFTLPDASRLEVSDLEWTLAPGVVLRSVNSDEPIRDAGKLVLWGDTFESEVEASEAGERWRNALRLAFASLGLAADLHGRHGPSMRLSPYGRELLESKTGKQVINDEHGLTVFALEPSPIFFGGGASGVGSMNASTIQTAMIHAFQLDNLKPASSLAYDLYSDAHFVVHPGAKLVLLMAAIEAMLKSKDREQPGLDHVVSLIAETKASNLPQDQKGQLLDALNGLKKESIRQSGRVLAQSLGKRTYLDRSPVDFFDLCYKLRNTVAHGRDIEPDRDLLVQATGQLGRFVGHLICGEHLSGFAAA